MKRIVTQKGDYYILYAPDGALSPDAAQVFRTAARTGADFIYADEIVQKSGGKEARIVKPGPSPDTLLSYNYIGSPLAVSAGLIERVGPPASGSAAERWAFTLRAFFAASFVLHLPRALYTGAQEQPCTDPSIVNQALSRLGRKAYAVPLPAADACTVRYAFPPDSRLSVLVAALGDRQAVRRTLESAERSNTELQIEYMVADGDAPDEAAEAYYGALEEAGVTVLKLWYQKNTARLFNRAAERAKGDAILLLRAGDTVESPDALSGMLRFALQEHVGAVCAWPARDECRRAAVRNVPIIERAPMLSRDALFSCGGLDESFAQSGCEAALSRRLVEKRLHLVETPDAIIKPGKAMASPGEKNQMRRRDIGV